MKSVYLSVLVLALALMTSCNSVQLNATYSQLLDQTSALSQETAARASRGELTPSQQTSALVGQARVWQMFRDARDGKTSATSQPSVRP